MCGIFGCINKNTSKFNKSIFNILGVANDSRGGDSCGIFIDGEVEYGIGATKLYQNFFMDSNLLKKNECKIALGHCRKASVGAKTIKEAQPVVIKNDKDEIEYCLMHNGTIHNYEDLAKKYIPNIDIKGMTDSQVMANIFYHKGYAALSEYNGAAVFTIVDYRRGEPKIFFWKGESKQSTYQPQISEERPFYHVIIDDTFIFSSIPEFLEGYAHDECWTIYSNTLIELSNNELFIVKKYDRSKCQQLKEYKKTDYTPAKTNDNNSSWGGSSQFIYKNKMGDLMHAGKKIHGKWFVSAYGTCYNYSYNSPQAQFMWFYQGLLLYNEACFKLIELIQNEMSKTNPEYNNPAAFIRDFPEIVGYFSYMPLRLSDEDEKYYEVTEDLMWKPYEGEFYNVLTDNNIINCHLGKAISKTHSTPILTFDYFRAASRSFYINEVDFINTINDLYNVSIQL